MSNNEQEIVLSFICPDCNAYTVINYSEELYDMVNSQYCAENRKCYCLKCSDG